MVAQLISNPSGDSNEKIEHAANILKSRPNCKKVFDAIYFGQKKKKTLEDIAEATGLSNQSIYKATQFLAECTIISTEKVDGKNAYVKVGFYSSHRDKIARLSENSDKLKEFPTKRNVGKKPQVILEKIQIQLEKKYTPEQVSLDDIKSFEKIKRIPLNSIQPDISQVEERTIKVGICKIIGEPSKSDWGGEANDIFSTRLNFKDKRLTAAFALKGKGTKKLNKGKLVPASMGKNGDQIQRLVNSEADVFLVQFNGLIEQSVLEQLKSLVIAKASLQSKKFYYGIIDGKDTARLMSAYPDEF